MEHWNYDTFQVDWDDPVQGKGFITFSIARNGKVKSINIEGIAEFDRVPEKKKKAEAK